MILKQLQQFLMPPRCAFCGVHCLPHELHLCAGCLDDLPWRDELLTNEQWPLEYSVVPLQYAFPVDAAIKALKFRRRLDYVPAFSEILCRASDALPDDVDALLPVPLHWRRHIKRGFNQATELAHALQRKSSLPMLSNFERCRATPFQSGLEAKARAQNLRHAFVARSRCAARHVLIVDDVITTGATSRELAKVVLAAGAEKVSVLALARTL